MNFNQLAAVLADEEKAIALVEQQRWPDGVVCPHCGVLGRAYRLQGKTTRKGLWKCGACRSQFTVRVNTIFEDSHIPLGKWLLAIHRMCSSKKGVSANQLSRELELTYKSSWFLCQRIRYAMKRKPLSGLLKGVVEADETYVGGRPPNNKHRGYIKRRKAIAVSLIQRDGEARSFRVDAASKPRLHALIRDNVEGGAVIMTDMHPSYKGIEPGYDHHTVDHRVEYVRGIVHTNFAESFFSLFKRGIVGSFHHISEKHMQRYLDEFDFRWNSRKELDGERTLKCVKQSEGKRLTYRQPIESSR